MKVLETLKRETPLSEIKVGEVFTLEGCWMVFYKTKRGGKLLGATDQTVDEMNNGNVYLNSHPLFSLYPIFKLPKSVQRLWKCE